MAANRRQGVSADVAGALFVSGAFGMAVLVIAYAQQRMYGQNWWSQTWFQSSFGFSAGVALVGAYLLAALWLHLPLPTLRGPAWMSRKSVAKRRL